MSRRFVVGAALFCWSTVFSTPSALGVDVQALIDLEIVKYELASDLPLGSLPVKDRDRIRMPKISLPPGDHVITKPLDCRGFLGLTIEGAGYGSKIVAQFNSQYTGYPMIDATGATRMTLRDVRISNGPSAVINGGAGIGVLFARFASANSAGQHLVDNVHIEGPYSVASMACVASEANTFTHVTFINHAAGGNTLLVSNTNLGGTIKSLEPIGVSSMLTARFSSCSFAKYVTEGGTVDPLIRYACENGNTMGNLHILGGNMSIREFTGEGGLPGETAILLDAPGSSGQLHSLVFRGIRAETNGTDHFIKVNSSLPRVVDRVKLEECLVLTAKSTIVYPDYMHFWDIAQCSFFILQPCPSQCEYSAVEADRLIRCKLDLSYSGSFTQAVTVDTYAADSTITVHGTAANLVTLPSNPVNVKIIELNN